MAASLSRLFAVTVQMMALLLAIQASSDAQTTTQTQVNPNNEKVDADAKSSAESSRFVCGNSFDLEVLLEDSRAARDQATWARLPQKRREQILVSSLNSTKAKAERDHRFLVNIAPIMLFISQSESVVAYEGAHREGLSKFQKIEEAETIRFGKSPFHRQPMSLSPEILSIVSDYHTFEADERGRSCVTFNRDVAFVFRKGDQSCEIIPCFECGDALIINGSKQLHAKLNIDAELRLLSLLKSQFQYWPKDEKPLGQ